MIHSACILGLLLVGPSPSPSAAPRRATVRMTPAEAEAAVREVSAEVEELRHLKFKTPVKMEIIDGATARANFKAKINPWDETEMKYTTNVYVHLGLIPRGRDLLAGSLDNVEKGVLGYYEPGTKVFYLLSHVSADEARQVMAHELTHALEDQNFDLGKLDKAVSGDGDRATALAAVIEGSAMGVMLAYENRHGDAKKAKEEYEKTEAERAARLRAAPSFTQRSLILPYTLGFTFLLRGKVWEWNWDGMKLADIDQAYSNPPFSTRQILHPEQYWVGKTPKTTQPLSFPDLSPVLGPGWSKVSTGSIGELGLAVLAGVKLDLESIDAFLPSRWTSKASAGVLADVYHHYVNGEQSVTVLVTRWESNDDALEFDEALVNRGRYFFRYGANVLVLGGDVGDKGAALAMAALQKLEYWPD